jgi:hypothetical protein
MPKNCISTKKFEYVEDLYFFIFFIYLNTAAPFVHQSIQPNLKQLVISQRSMRHHHPVIELVQRSFPLSRPTVVAQFDQSSVALVEPNFAVVSATTTSGRHGTPAASSVVERQRIVVVVLANEETGSGSDGDAGSGGGGHSCTGRHGGRLHVESLDD